MRLSCPPPLRGSSKNASRSPKRKQDHGRASTQLFQPAHTLVSLHLAPHRRYRPVARHTSFIAIARDAPSPGLSAPPMAGSRGGSRKTDPKLGKRHSGREAGSQSRESPADRPTARDDRPMTLRCLLTWLGLTSVATPACAPTLNGTPVAAAEAQTDG